MTHALTGEAAARGYYSRVSRSEILPSQFFVCVDFDGTLVEICADPDEARLSLERRTRLNEIFSGPSLSGLVVSGRNREFLSSQLDGIPVALAAEHGSFFRLSQEKPWVELLDDDITAEIDLCERLMRESAAQYPGTFVERKERSVVFHFRTSNPPLLNAPKELVGELYEKISSGLKLTLGRKILEVRPNSVSKGTIGTLAVKLMGGSPEHASILGIGDDETDEDLFAYLRQIGQFSICVGTRPSMADIRLSSPEETYRFLEELKRLIETDGMREKGKISLTSD